MAARTIQPLLADTVPPVLGDLFWGSGYYREVARRSDQIAVMTYDSGMPIPQIYRLWTRLEIIQVSRALDGTGVTLLIGVPTSEEETRTHLPSAENMSNGVQGIVDGLNDGDSRPGAVTGIAIYPDWETDDTEWATYEQIWLGKP